MTHQEELKKINDAMKYIRDEYELSNKTDDDREYMIEMLELLGSRTNTIRNEMLYKTLMSKVK